MISYSLLPIVFALGAYSQGQEADGSGPILAGYGSLTTKKAEIQKNLKIDKDRRPFFKSDEHEEKPCFAHWFKCWWAKYHIRNEVNTGATFRVYYSVNIELSNTAKSKPSEMRISKSHSKIDSTTEGWSIGVQASANNLKGPGGSVSYDRSYQKTEQTQYTKERTVRHDCPPYHQCRIETVTWHVEMTGTCRRVPIIDCGGASRVCDQSELTCPSYKRFTDRWCDTAAYNVEECKVTAPIFQGPDDPYSEYHFFEEPIKPKVLAWEAIGEGENCITIAKLDIDEDYDPKSGKFYTDAKGTFEWQTRPKVPKPDIDEKQMPDKCTKSSKRSLPKKEGVLKWAVS